MKSYFISYSHTSKDGTNGLGSCTIKRKKKITAQNKGDIEKDLAKQFEFDSMIILCIERLPK